MSQNEVDRREPPGSRCKCDTCRPAARQLQIVSAKWLLILPCVDLPDTGRGRAGNDRPVDGMCTPAGVAALLG